MTEWKSWISSKGVWGGLIAVLSVVLGFIGLEISADDQAELINSLTMIGAAVGGVVAIVGRVLASKKIGKEPTE